MGNQHLVVDRYLWFDEEIRRNRYPNARNLAERYEISERTAQRTIARLRDQLGAPLLYNQRRRGYFYDAAFTLPDLPISQEELLAILLARKLLTAADSGFIGQAIQRFGRKLFRSSREIGIDEVRISRCFSAVWHGHSSGQAAVFRTVSRALLNDRQLTFTYHSPQQTDPVRRTVEPHHLQHYMGSWVLLAWCTLRRDWRHFYLARMDGATVAEQQFARRPASSWRHLLDTSFGIFQGAEIFPVIIRFSPAMSRWVRQQTWHPAQETRENPDGSLILTLPAADLREIKMKILQFGPTAEALAPVALRELLRQEAEQMYALYAKTDT
ncbi:MAG: helix-turn-helix transcriptional regulator [Thermodesulfobacteriota bacterium]